MTRVASIQSLSDTLGLNQAAWFMLGIEATVRHPEWAQAVHLAFAKANPVRGGGPDRETDMLVDFVVQGVEFVEDGE